MKIALFVLTIVALASVQAYETKFDNVDLDQILKSDRLLNNYFKCLMDEGKCTPDAKELKSK